MARNKARAPHSHHPPHPTVQPEPPTPPCGNTERPRLYVPPRSPPQSPNHHLMKLMKTLLVVLFALRFQLKDSSPADMAAWLELCRRDFKYCPSCFDPNLHGAYCMSFENRVKLQHSFAADFNSIFSPHRRMRYATYNKIPAVIKEGFDEMEIMRMRVKVCESVDDETPMDCDTMWRNPPNPNLLAWMLIKYYLDLNKPGIVRVLPPESVPRFLEVFGRHYKNPVMPVVRLIMDPEPMIMRTMFAAKMAVPNVLLECGFLTVQSFEGTPLAEFYSYPFYERLKIARNILDMVMKFAAGIDGFRIYLTDASKDNIVVDKETFAVAFVDLDSVVIVDAKENPYSNETHPAEALRWQTVHRHEIVKCDGCFSYSEEDLQKHFLSDHNIYAVCDLFVWDLYGNQDNGFLHSVPKSIQTNIIAFGYLVAQCLRCALECTNRYEVARNVVQIFDIILEHQ